MHDILNIITINRHTQVVKQNKENNKEDEPVIEEYLIIYKNALNWYKENVE